MDLRGGAITVGELMRSKDARAILQREFPGVVGSPMFRMAQGMSLNQVLRRVSGRVPQDKVRRVVEELREA